MPSFNCSLPLLLKSSYERNLTAQIPSAALYQLGKYDIKIGFVLGCFG
jgi:hypothetical protein